MNRGTELFELFGEEVHCSICLTDVEQGERVRAINVCQHTFHATCLEEWGLRRLECPNCRQPFGGDPTVAEEDLVPVLVPPVAEAPIQLQLQVRLPTEDELLLTFTLFSGILQRFPSARGYLWNRELIQTQMEALVIAEVRPFIVVTYQNRNQMVRDHARCRYHLGIRLQNPPVGRNISTHPLARLWKERLINHWHRSNTDFWKIWVRDSRGRREVMERIEREDEQQVQ